jgi:hypothetical protein
MKPNHREILREIREIKKRLRLVEKKAASLKRERKVSPEEAFRKKFPSLRVDPELFKLVGIDPPLSLRSEKRAIREAISWLYESK